MPILDVTLLAESAPSTLAQSLADAAASVLGGAPGRVWVRLHLTPGAHYAENAAPAPQPLPVFVTLLHAHPPEGEARAAEASALAQALAPLLERPVERVHIEYAAPGAGRLAFGGQLVR